MDLEERRREYRHAKLRREDLSDSPFQQFDRWMQDAIDAQVQDPTAMCVATVGENNRPSQRIVLLKHNDESGFVFYTNLESRKAHEISLNKQVSLHFAWLEIDRQVHIEGTAEKLATSTVLKYFMTRPKESQLAAWASAQSSRISARSILDDEFQRLKQKFQNKEIPLPSFWGGFRVVPKQWEFWQGGEHRLHDRFQYISAGDSWEIVRLAP